MKSARAGGKRKVARRHTVHGTVRNSCSISAIMFIKCVENSGHMCGALARGAEAFPKESEQLRAIKN